MSDQQTGPDSAHVGTGEHAHAGTGGFVISLDFELMWGVRDQYTIAGYGPNILGVRQVVPRLLDLFDRHALGCTWATVGMLFFDDRDALMAALPSTRPAYADRSLSPYGALDQVGPNERDDPYHFGLALIRQIAAAPHQEIATHTFSHFYCLEPGQDTNAFRADLAAANYAAASIGITLRSIVFPRNQLSAAHLEVCRTAGLTAFRGVENTRNHAPRALGADNIARRGARLADTYINLTGQHGARPAVQDGMVNIPSSRFLRPWSPNLTALEPLRLRRILKAMRHAAERGEVFHLWFHPHNFGVNQDQNFAVMERIAQEAVRLRDLHGWPSLTMAEAAHSTLVA